MEICICIYLAEMFLTLNLKVFSSVVLQFATDPTTPYYKPVLLTHYLVGSGKVLSF